MSIREAIAKKRDGLELSTQDIGETIDSYLAGRASDAQMAALLMAIVLRGMSERETADLTLAMVASGRRLDLSGIPGTKVDKHSTGGVGDKTTLVVAPLAAALGARVPKMSGRALGHTGGTIDKLGCIPGLRTDLSPERFCRQVAEIGVAIAAQTEEMVPADKKLYALRDATGTVESVPLIASSVMSKKLAVGADAIVLDVKAGRGAFMPDVERARELAQAMVGIGLRAGKQMVALVTRMDDPIGEAVGDGPELVEAIHTLAGQGPADFSELCHIVAGHMLSAGGVARDPEDGRARAARALASGTGLPKLREMVLAQGGAAEVVDDADALIVGAERTPVEAPRDGYVAGIDPRRIGLLVRDLEGVAGERRGECGVLLHKKRGQVVAGEPVATILAPPGALDSLPEAVVEVQRAFEIAERESAVPAILAAVVKP